MKTSMIAFPHCPALVTWQGQGRNSVVAAAAAAASFSRRKTPAEGLMLLAEPMLQATQRDILCCVKSQTTPSS